MGQWSLREAILASAGSGGRRVATLSMAVLLVAGASGLARAQDTFQGLASLDPGDPSRFSYANGVSADGTTVIGESATVGGGSSEAFRWNGGTMTGLGFLDPTDPTPFSYAAAVSADGATVVGYSTFEPPFSVFGMEAVR